MLFGDYDSGLENEKCKKIFSITSEPLVKSQVFNRRSFVLLTLRFDPTLISFIDSWCRVIDEMRNISLKLKSLLNYCFMVTSVEPYIVKTSDYDINNEVVEIEGFFTQKYFEVNKSNIKRAIEVFQYVKDNIKQIVIILNQIQTSITF